MIFNPFAFTAFGFVLALLLSLLGWSDYYDGISDSVLIFFVVLIAVLLITAFMARKIFKIKPHDKCKDFSVLPFIFLFLGYVCDWLYSGNIGLLNVINGGLYYKDIDHFFGYSLLKVFSAYCCVRYFQCWIVNNRSVSKWLFFFLLLLIFSNVNRSILFFTISSCSLVYIFYKPFSFRSILRLAIVVIIFLNLFVLVGSKRADNYKNETFLLTTGTAIEELILVRGAANESYYNSGMPVGFFWLYIYLVSPIENFDSLAITDGDNPEFWGITKTLLPEVFRNSLDIEERDKNYLVTDTFNTYTYFGLPMQVGGIYGVIISLLAMYFIYLFYGLLRFSPDLRLVMLSFVSTAAGLSVFSNLLVHDLIFFLFFFVSIEYIQGRYNFVFRASHEKF